MVMINPFQLRRKIIITCSNRLAPWLEKEISELGYTPVNRFKTGIELSGTLEDCMKLNMHLRCASQVLFSLYRITARNGEELYREAGRLDWDQIIPQDGYFSITSQVNNLSVNNELYANVKLKDAIVDRFRKLTGKRPDSGPRQDHTVIHLYWQDEQVELFADTSGETLSKHGYRRIPGKAPMLESLAAATLLATKWDRSTPFINPMCGSATLAIEAALIVTNRKPGLYRNNYGFMHLNGYRQPVYDRLRTELEKQVKVPSGLKIIATDISRDAINISTINAGVAGVGGLIEFAVCPFEDTGIPNDQSGVVFFNPEYGERLGEAGELEDTYKKMGDFLKQRCKGYTGYVFTGNLELAKKIGLKPDRRIEFFSGKIDCRLLEYALYEGSRVTGKPVKAETAD
jgi:putative N6-adenine-specific DNA methylase